MARNRKPSLARITVTAQHLVEGDRVEFATGRQVTVVRITVGCAGGTVWLEFSDREFGYVPGHTRYTVLTHRNRPRT